MTEAVKAIGLPHLTSQKVVNYLRSKEPSVEISVDMTRKILRNTLGLTFKQCKFANDRQTDSQFYAQQLKVARTLAHLFLSDVLVIGVDESSFNHIQTNNRQWQPGTKRIRLMD